jgi:two-component system LytT family sensor kinase
MKVRWREHEVVLIAIITVIIIAGYVGQLIGLSAQQIKADYAAPFIKENLSFSYFSRILLPQIGSVLILLLVYFWINRRIIPVFSEPGKRSVWNCLGAVLQIIPILYLIGPGINFISFYANPYYMSQSGKMYAPLGFGGHPQPFKNVWGGITEAFFLLVLYAIYAVFREVVIWYVERLNSRRSYRILISNQITLALVVFFVIPAFTSVFGLITNPVYYRYYFAFMIPVLMVFTTNIYWLFPLKGDKPFLKWQFMGPLLFSTFVYTLIFSIFLQDKWTLFTMLGCWAAQMCIISPISWLDFQQRKGKILQLRGVEEALVKSKADLQFLRSQINPHFLFNALNTLYGTALMEGSKNTAQGIQQLGDMMRFMLHDNTMDFIDMSKEIDYLKNYISLQKLRTQASPDITIEDTIAGDDCNYKIAPMLLIPFVENAFKHGISLTGRSWIKIGLDCEAGKINFEVHNSTHSAVANDPEKGHSGIGLRNVQERLLLLYPGKHQFKYGIEGDEFVVRLSIQPL